MRAYIDYWNGVAFDPLDLSDYGVIKVSRENVTPPPVTPITVAPIRAISETYIRTDVGLGELDLKFVVRTDTAYYTNVRKLQALLQRFKATFSDDSGYVIYTMTQIEATRQPLSLRKAILTLHCTYEINTREVVAKTWSSPQRVEEYLNIETGKETFLTFAITTGANVTGDLTVNGVYIANPPASTTFYIGANALLEGNTVDAEYNDIPTGKGSTYININGSDGASFCSMIELRYVPRW